MRNVRRTRPTLESLENRLCPTGLTVRFISGTLYISGDSTSRIINLNQTLLTGQIQVFDNTSLLGTFSANSINLQTGNAAETVTLTLAGSRTFNGNVSLTTGNGNDQIVVTGDGSGLPQISGNLTINTGQGTNQVTTGTTGSFQVSGNVLLQGAGSDTFTIEGGTVINGNLSATDPTGTFQLGGSGDGAAVKGNVTINGAGSHNVTVTPNGGVFGNFQSSTGGGLNQVTINAPILGNVNVTETGSPSNLTLTSLVGGSLTYTGSGTNSVNLILASMIGGDATLNLGNGDSNYTLGGAATIYGSLRVNAGNGTDIGFLNGTINRNLSITVGNGANTLTIANAPGGVLSWTSGNGNSSLMLGFSLFTTGPETWTVNVRFGTGSDTFALSGAVAPTHYLTGFVDMGGPPGGNSFDPAHALGVNWQVLGPFTIQNV